MKAIILLEDGQKMVAELYKDMAPITVSKFVELAKSGFYSGLIFHRVIDSFMIQGGGMDINMHEKRTSSIKGEFLANGVNNTLSHSVGVLSMARTMDPNSASSQFFICVAPAEYLNGNYAAFGKLCDEESVATAIAIGKSKTHSVGFYDDVPINPLVIKTIRIEE